MVMERAEPGEMDEVKEEKPEPLSEKQLNEVPIAVEVFSMEVVGPGAQCRVLCWRSLYTCDVSCYTLV